MRWRVISGAVWVALLVTALWVNSTFAQWGYSPAVEQWRGAVNEACAVYGCSPDYVLGVIACESGGDPGAVSEAINPGTGTHDYGLLQVSTIWGGQNMGPVEQIWFFASPPPGAWWSCG